MVVIAGKGLQLSVSSPRGTVNLIPIGSYLLRAACHCHDCNPRSPQVTTAAQLHNDTGCVKSQRRQLNYRVCEVEGQKAGLGWASNLYPVPSSSQSIKREAWGRGRASGLHLVFLPTPLVRPCMGVST